MTRPERLCVAAILLLVIPPIAGAWVDTSSEVADQKLETVTLEAMKRIKSAVDAHTAGDYTEDLKVAVWALHRAPHARRHRRAIH